MELKVFDLTQAASGEMDIVLGGELAECFHETGCAIVKDPRVQSADNDRFLDLMERYFSQDNAVKEQETRPELHYQVGLTPAGVEIPEAVYDPATLSHLDGLLAENLPRIPTGPDPKCRYMWRIGPPPTKTAFQELNAGPVIPKAFPEWKEVLDAWGHKLLTAVQTVAELLSVGLGIENLVHKMHYGPHLLAPTGVDLSQHRELNTCIAGYHSDINLLTIHGRSRYPGLHIWLSNGTRMPVKLPEGCLLVQSGQQLEILTGNWHGGIGFDEVLAVGGYIKAGMHEVVVSEETQQVLKKSESLGCCSWRVSSTLFSHVASDEVLHPVGKFKTQESEETYPTIVAGDFIAQRLRKISLHHKKV